jgi:hypothetical protein
VGCHIAWHDSVAHFELLEMLVPCRKDDHCRVDDLESNFLKLSKGEYSSLSQFYNSL